jgi:hypothetical protein
MSPENQADAVPRGNTDGVGPLLDSAFGFFVWAVHFLVVYVSTATACQLGLGDAGRGGRIGFVAVMLGLTAVAAALVVLHGLRRYKRDRDDAERRFRMGITVGCDGLAAIAIAWQSFALLLMPLCV